MLAKVIAPAESGPGRGAAVAAARLPMLGVRTNILPLGVSSIHRAGEIDTAFLDTEGAAIAERIPPRRARRPRGDRRANEEAQITRAAWLPGRRPGLGSLAALEGWRTDGHRGLAQRTGSFQRRGRRQAQVVSLPAPRVGSMGAAWNGYVFHATGDPSGQNDRKGPRGQPRRRSLRQCRRPSSRCRRAGARSQRATGPARSDEMECQSARSATAWCGPLPGGDLVQADLQELLELE